MKSNAEYVLEFDVPVQSSYRHEPDLDTYTDTFLRDNDGVIGHGQWLLGSSMVEEGRVKPLAYRSVTLPIAEAPRPEIVTIGLDRDPDGPAGWQIGFKHHYFAVYGDRPHEHSVHYERDSQGRLRNGRVERLDRSQIEWLAHVIQRLAVQPVVTDALQRVQALQEQTRSSLQALQVKAKDDSQTLTAKEVHNLKAYTEISLQPLPWTPLRIKPY